MPPYDWGNGGSADAFLHMMSMVLLLWGICTILGNGYGIHGQNCCIASGNLNDSRVSLQEFDIRCITF